MASPSLATSILQDVCAYIAVKSNSGKDLACLFSVQLTKLGAKVEALLTDRVTHIIYKNGGLDVIQFAKVNAIPLVSVLWIERCKECSQQLPIDDYLLTAEQCCLDLATRNLEPAVAHQESIEARFERLRVRRLETFFTVFEDTVHETDNESGRSAASSRNATRPSAASLGQKPTPSFGGSRPASVAAVVAGGSHPVRLSATAPAESAPLLPHCPSSAVLTASAGQDVTSCSTARSPAHSPARIASPPPGPAPLLMPSLGLSPTHIDSVCPHLALPVVARARSLALDLAGVHSRSVGSNLTASGSFKAPLGASALRRSSSKASTDFDISFSSKGTSGSAGISNANLDIGDVSKRSSDLVLACTGDFSVSGSSASNSAYNIRDVREYSRAKLLLLPNSTTSSDDSVKKSDSFNTAPKSSVGSMPVAKHSLFTDVVENSAPSAQVIAAESQLLAVVDCSETNPEDKVQAAKLPHMGENTVTSCEEVPDSVSLSSDTSKIAESAEEPESELLKRSPSAAEARHRAGEVNAATAGGRKSGLSRSCRRVAATPCSGQRRGGLSQTPSVGMLLRGCAASWGDEPTVDLELPADASLLRASAPRGLRATGVVASTPLQRVVATRARPSQVWPATWQSLAPSGGVRLLADAGRLHSSSDFTPTTPAERAKVRAKRLRTARRAATTARRGRAAVAPPATRTCTQAAPLTARRRAGATTGCRRLRRDCRRRLSWSHRLTRRRLLFVSDGSGSGSGAAPSSSPAAPLPAPTPAPAASAPLVAPTAPSARKTAPKATTKTTTRRRPRKAMQSLTNFQNVHT